MGLLSALSWPEGGGALFSGLPEGVSAGFTTLALVPDDLDADAGARRFAGLLGEPCAPVARLKQVHGAVVVEPGIVPPREVVVAGAGDALVTTERGLVLAIATADCVPVVLVDAEAGALAVVHAGWRGTAARIVDAALDALVVRGARIDRIQALFGPSISGAVYEVGPEVLAALDGTLPAAAVAPGRGDRSWLDVAACNEAALRARGVGADRIFRPRLCTFLEKGRFSSFRRDGANAGRIYTGAVLRERPTAPAALS
ncbi:MAG: polyphenol oxidase family protein [Holophagales bacterium]|nr:polyphenol oxidase family protein [Holophagales bacterium]